MIVVSPLLWWIFFYCWGWQQNWGLNHIQYFRVNFIFDILRWFHLNNVMLVSPPLFWGGFHLHLGGWLACHWCRACRQWRPLQPYYTPAGVGVGGPPAGWVPSSRRSPAGPLMPPLEEAGRPQLTRPPTQAMDTFEYIRRSTEWRPRQDNLSLVPKAAQCPPLPFSPLATGPTGSPLVGRINMFPTSCIPSLPRLFFFG